jgi:hypothetical protein
VSNTSIIQVAQLVILSQAILSSSRAKKAATIKVAEAGRETRKKRRRATRRMHPRRKIEKVGVERDLSVSLTNIKPANVMGWIAKLYRCKHVAGT